MSQLQTPTKSVESETFCVNHPTVATSLRCNRCGNPICVKCAVRTPVGYRCKNCVHNQQAAFYTALPTDYVIAALITLPLAAIGQFIGPMLGFFAFFVGPIVGGLIAELVWRATGRRRGRYTWLVVAACMVIAALPALLMSLVPVAFSVRFNALGVLGVLWPIIYLVLAVGTAITRLRFGK